MSETRVSETRVPETGVPETRVPETGARPFAWERSYPVPGLWDAPIQTGTLPALLAGAVARFGPKTAIEFRDCRLTYAELGGLAARAAAGFRRLGLSRGDRVALLLPNTPWHPVMFFGALQAGGVVVHLSPLDPPRVLARKMADSGARLLVTTDVERLLPAALELLGEGADRVVVADDAAWGGPGLPVPPDGRVLRWADFAGEASEGGASEGGASEGGAADGGAAPVDEHDVALLQYTGGTTGLPRAAMLTHANLTSAVSMGSAWSEATGSTLTPDDKVILVLPLFHIYALVVVLLRPLSLGAALLMRPRFDVDGVLDDIERKRATAFPGVPTMWIALANHPGIEARDFSSLTAVGSGGAPLPAEVQQRFTALTGLKLGGGWGMTETAPAGTVLVAGQAYGPGAIGVPLPGIEMDVAALDDPSRTLKTGETGELRIRGANVFKGYWNRPDETRTAFRDGWFLTGDMGFMDEDGVFYIVDRKKDMIISGGFNVYPRVIEDAVYEHPAVAEAVVIGVPDPYRGQAAKAFVTLKPEAARLTLDDLRAFLGDKLGRHEMPVALELRETLPRTPVGKLSRKELVDEERARAALNA